MPKGTMDISEARSQFSSLDKRLLDQKFIKITRHGKDAFVVVNTDYLEAIIETLDILADPEAVVMLQNSIDDITHGRLYDQGDVEKEFL